MPVTLAAWCPVNFIVYRLAGTTLVPCSRPQAHGAAASTPSLSAGALCHKRHLCWQGPWQGPCQTPCASAPGVHKQLLHVDGPGAHQQVDSEEVLEGLESDSHFDLSRCRSNSDQDSDSESCPHQMDLTGVGSTTASAHSKFKFRKQNFKLKQSQWRTKHRPVGGLFQVVRWSACPWQPE